MSKGSWYRPVNQKKYGENYDQIFGKKKPVFDRAKCCFGETCRSECTDCLIGQAIEETENEHNQ